MARFRNFIKGTSLFIILVIAILGLGLRNSWGQYFNPYYFPVTPFVPWVVNPFIPFPEYVFPTPTFSPVPIYPTPYTRSPAATIIISPGITAVSPSAGVLVIGSPTVVNPTTVTTVAPTATVSAAPAPLFSLLSILYTSALYAPALLSTANPLLFAYLSSLVI